MVGVKGSGATAGSHENKSTDHFDSFGTEPWKLKVILQINDASGGPKDAGT